MAITTFVRKEIKYLINEEQKKFLLSHLSKYMNYDNYCQNGALYTVNNIYFDTPTFNVIRNSLSKPTYKAKLRMRCYKNSAKGSDIAFLEIKKKISGVVNKRRVVMSIDELERYLDTGIRPKNLTSHQQQIFNEIDYVLAYEKIEPKLYLSYERLAMFDKVDPELRLTIDNDILTRTTDITLKSARYGDSLLPKGFYLMEIKASGAYPMWLVHLLSEAKIYPRSFSKYGTFYHNYVRENRNYE